MRHHLLLGLLVVTTMACAGRTLELVPPAPEAGAGDASGGAQPGSTGGSTTVNTGNSVGPGILTEGPLRTKWAESLGERSAITALDTSDSGELHIGGVMRQGAGMPGALTFGSHSLQGHGAFTATRSSVAATGIYSSARAFETDANNRPLLRVELAPGWTGQGTRSALALLVTCSGEVDLGGGPLSPIDNTMGLDTLDACMAVSTSSGEYAWGKRWSSVTPLGVVAADYEGTNRPSSFVVTSRLNGSATSADLGGGPLSGGFFIAKLDGNGNHVWSHGFGDPDKTQVTGVAAEGNAGHIYVTGAFTETLDFGHDPLHSAGGWDVFLAAFDRAGVFLWSKRFGDANDQGLEATVAVEPFSSFNAAQWDSDIVLAGTFEGTVDFGGGALTSKGDLDIYVARFSRDGEPRWSKGFGSPTSDITSGVTVDDYDGTVVIGNYGGPIDFGGGVLRPIPPSGVRAETGFVAKLNARGEHVWSQGFGDACSPIAVTTFPKDCGDATDCESLILVAGAFSGNVDFGSGISIVGSDANSSQNPFLVEFANDEHWEH